MGLDVKTIKKSLDPKRTSIYLILFMLVSLFMGIGLYVAWNLTLAEQDAMIILELSLQNPRASRLNQAKERQARLTRSPVKGLYLTAYSAGSNKKVTEIVNLINKTELNAVVIDIKDYSGNVLYNSDVPLVNELDLEDYRIGRLPELIMALHNYDIYVIARQTVFQDPILAEKKPEWALKNKQGTLWRDYKGLAWVDPAKQEIWDYNVDIAKEAISLGFDEINFDYVRFPSDGNIANIEFDNGGREKYQVMGDFYDYMSRNLTGLPANISVDFFGFVMERSGTDDLSIGQRLEDALDEFDAISPMMYPSHYPSGHLGLNNPADYPGLVIENGMQKGAYRFENRRAVLRPWIQAFNLGAVYDADKIRTQINTVEKYTDGGWLLWNAANRYSDAGLKYENGNFDLISSIEDLIKGGEDK